MFTKDEQQAILQCIWQLLAPAPSDSDSELIENTISKEWECKDEFQDISPIEKWALKHQLNVNNPKPWILCAVQLSPYTAFSTIANMPNEKKEVFLKMCLKVVKNGGNVDYKYRMLISLLDQTNVPYRFVKKTYPGIEGVFDEIESIKYTIKTYPNFTKDEQKAILHIASAVAFNGDWHVNAKRLLNAIGHRFNFSLQETGDSITLDRQKALSIIKGLDSEKKKLATILFMSAAMADGDMSLGKPQWETFHEILTSCNLPIDVPFRDALDITHNYLGC